MNIDQLQSLLRSLLKIAGSALMAHGLTQAAGIVNGEDFIGVVLALGGLAWSHWEHGADAQPPPPSGKLPGPKVMLWLLVGTMCGWILSGCAGLAPGADPLVVRTEQLETVAYSALDNTVSLDNADRGFWRTNAPAFHGFCEWLREPVPTPTNPNEPRGLGMILLLDSAKVSYEANKSQSNTLLNALSALQIVLNQAAAWQTIITNQPSTH